MLLCYIRSAWASGKYVKLFNGAKTILPFQKCHEYAMLSLPATE